MTLTQWFGLFVALQHYMRDCISLVRSNLMNPAYLEQGQDESNAEIREVENFLYAVWNRLSSPMYADLWALPMRRACWATLQEMSQARITHNRRRISGQGLPVGS